MNKPISNRYYIQLEKTAGVLDVLETLGVELGVMGAGAAVGAGSAAAAGTSVGAGALGGAGLLVSNPLGWAILILSAGATVASVIYAASQTNDQLEDLISRIESLDTNWFGRWGHTPKWVEVFKDEWIGKLTQLNEEIGTLRDQLESVVPRSKEEEGLVDKMRAEINAKLVEKLTEALEYLTNLKNYQWPKAYRHFTDVGLDVRQVKQSLDANVKFIRNNIKRIKTSMERAKAAAEKKLFESTKHERTSKITLLITEIKSLTSQITTSWSAPKFSDDERNAIAKGSAILGEEPTPEKLKEAEAVMPTLIKIRDELRGYLAQIKKRRRTSSHVISKRAVEVPGLTPTRSPTKRRRPTTKSMPVVESLQRSINYMRTAGQVTDAPYLKEDGVYGANTARALMAVLNKYTAIADYLRTNGVPLDQMANPQFANSAEGIRFVNFTNRVLERFKQYGQGRSQKELTPQQQGQPKQDEQMQAPRGMAPRCVDKANPTTQDILNCLQGTWGYVGNTRTNIYDYMRANGMDDNAIIKMIVDMYGGRSPRIWSPVAILKKVKHQYG